MASDWLGVSIAPDDTLITPSPTWERLDDGVTGLRVSSIRVRSGKSSAFEQTGTGTCEVVFKDRLGVLDPTNSGSPYFGKLLSRPFAVAIRNPVTDVWWPLFRGAVDDAGYAITRSQTHEETAIVAVDAFDYFANFELIPGLTGFVSGVPNTSGYVEYPEAEFDERIAAHILGDIGWPTELYSVFTGNIVCAQSRYSSGDTVLQALQEAVEAEFPTVAAQYVDKRGRYQAHGRYARFDPDTVSASATNWDFNRWKAGDNAAARADTGAGGTAKLQEPYGFGISRKLIRNAALCYPQDTDQSDLADYIYTDETSRTEHGTRTWTAPNLQIAEETTIGLTAKEYCQYIAEYIVENYKDPIPGIPQLTVGTEHPTADVFGAATWEFICESNISDVVGVTIGHPGGGGFSDEEYYIEGFSAELRPGPGSLDNAFPIMKYTCDLTPVSRWANNPFGAVPT